jgi:hypothetical protein
MAAKWHKLTDSDRFNWDDVFVFHGDPEAMFIQSNGYEIALSPEQRTQLAYLLLTGKPLHGNRPEEHLDTGTVNLIDKWLSAHDDTNKGEIQ